MKFKKLDEIENYLSKIAWKGYPSTQIIFFRIRGCKNLRGFWGGLFIFILIVSRKFQVAVVKQSSFKQRGILFNTLNGPGGINV